MKRDDSDQELDDPRAEVRAMMLQQQQQPQEAPAPTPDPVYDTPSVPTWSESNPWDNQPPPQPPPQPQFTPSNVDVTDPRVRIADAFDPNSPEELARQNAIYGPGGTAMNPPSPTSTFNPTSGSWNAPAPTPAPPASARPTNGSLTDPNFASQLVAWAGQQPGVNPSVRNDPNYWIGRFTSGAFGNDQNYAIQRMMQAEGAPEGAGAARTTTTPAAQRTSVAAPTSFNFAPATSNAPQGAWNSDFITQVRALLMQRLQANSQPLDPNDPNISLPLTAARDEATRHSDKERTDLAEHLYASGGLNTDAIGQKIQQSGERNASSLAGLRATLITRELTARRDELKSLMQMALQSGDAESAAAIQAQIAALNAQVNREGLGLDAAKYAAYLNTIGAEQVMN